jgi:hypothetical protein
VTGRGALSKKFLMLYSSSRVQVFKGIVPINLIEKSFSMEPLDDLSATVSLLKPEPNDATTLKKPEYLPSKGYLIFDRTAAEGTKTRAMEIAQRKVGVPVQRRQLDEL